jgi:hypothetical protein
VDSLVKTGRGRINGFGRNTQRWKFIGTRVISTPRRGLSVVPGSFAECGWLKADADAGRAARRADTASVGEFSAWHLLGTDARNPHLDKEFDLEPPTDSRQSQSVMSSIKSLTWDIRGKSPERVECAIIDLQTVRLSVLIPVVP